MSFRRAILIFMILPALFSCGRKFDSPSSAVILTAQAQADAQGFLAVSGTANLSDGAVLLIVARPGEDRGFEMERAQTAVTAAGKFHAVLTVDLPIAYRIEVILNDKLNPGRADLFADIGPGRIAPPAAARKSPNGRDEIVVAIDARLGTEDRQRAAVAQSIGDLNAMLRMVKGEREAVEKVQTSPQSAPGWLRRHDDHMRNFNLNKPSIDPFFPGAHGKIKRAMESLTDCLAFSLAKQAGDETEVKRLIGAYDSTDRFIKMAQSQLADIQKKNSDLLPSE